MCTLENIKQFEIICISPLRNILQIDPQIKIHRLDQHCVTRYISFLFNFCIWKPVLFKYSYIMSLTCPTAMLICNPKISIQIIFSLRLASIVCKRKTLSRIYKLFSIFRVIQVIRLLWNVACRQKRSLFNGGTIKEMSLRLVFLLFDKYRNVFARAIW